MIICRCYTTGADVIAQWIFIKYYGWCYCHYCGGCYYHNVYIILYMAGVIAIYVWQMLLPPRLTLLPTIFVFLGWCYCQNSGRCYNHYINVWADAIAQCIFIKYYGWCYCHYCGGCYYHIVYIILYMAGVMPYMCGRCYCHWGWCYCLPYLYFLADGIARIVAGVITTILNVLADGIAKWQMDCLAYMNPGIACLASQSSELARCIVG